MGHSDEAKWTIVVRWKQGCSASVIAKELEPLHGIKIDYVKFMIAKYKKCGDVKDAPRSGRPKSVRTPEATKKIATIITKNPTLSAPQVAQKADLSTSSARRILTEDLGLTPYRRRKSEALSDKHKAARVTLCRGLLALTTPENAIDTVLFTDEKWFVLNEKTNSQNNRVWAATFEDAVEAVGDVQWDLHPAKVMVWAGISARGRTGLVFFKKGDTVTSKVYQRDVLEGELRQAGPRIFGTDDWTLMQDGASAHTSKATDAWCMENIPKFWNKSQWPAKSPDLNPCDFYLWGRLQAIVNSSPIPSVQALKQRLKKAYGALDDDEVAAACRSVTRRLKQCIDSKGSRFTY